MHFFELFLIGLAIVFLLSGIDDLIIDFVHLVNGIKPDQRSVNEWKAMDERSEQSIAIMVPAWNESDVLGAMIRTNSKRIRYLNYQWFVGVYPNDEATLAVARELEREFPDQFNLVVVDREGPTSKAHCLNNVITAIEAKIARGAFHPEFVVLHDAEDVIHPDSFTTINSEPSEIEFFQIPVFSLRSKYFPLVSGTYMDEFAENHLKELPARQKMGLPIPSAGVGTFLRWKAVMVAKKEFGLLFNEASLTEDYELSMRLAHLGCKQKFVTMRTRDHKSLVATHGYFPDRIHTSVRQKTRWIIGITLQSVPAVKKRSWAERYGHFRDRKGLITNPINLLGWVAYFTTLILISTQNLTLFHHQGILERLFYLNAFIFFIRIIQRFRFTYAIYGFNHAWIGVARILMLNYINMAATLRAFYQYSKPAPGATNKKKMLKWDKTDHRFPEADELSDSRP